VVAYHAEHLDEVIVAEQGGLSEGEKALLDLLKKRLRRDLRESRLRRTKRRDRS
jgi:hypothetical protein